MEKKYIFHDNLTPNKKKLEITFTEVINIFVSAKLIVKKIVFRKKLFIFAFGLCSRLKKVLYGFFNCFLREINVRVLKYCILG